MTTGNKSYKSSAPSGFSHWKLVQALIRRKKEKKRKRKEH